MKNKCMHLDSNVLYSVKLKERGSYYVMICSFVPIVVCNLFEFLDLALDSSNVSSNNFSNLNAVLEEHESGHSTDRVFLGDILINVRSRLIKSDACCTMIAFFPSSSLNFSFFFRRILSQASTEKSLTPPSSTSTLANWTSG